MHARPFRITVVALALLLGLGALSAIGPSPAAAVSPTSQSVESYLLGWTNRDRAARGLRPIRLDSGLRTAARERAANLVASSVFSHDAAGGEIGSFLREAGLPWISAAEGIAYMPGSYGVSAASAIYRLLRKSPGHWAMMMSSRYNYVGIGAAERSRDHRTFASLVFTEARDHTPPSVKVTSATRSGTSVTFHWSGHDPALQTHTAGFRDFDVRYRTDGGAWHLVRDNTTAHGTRWLHRSHGHWVYVSVRGRDRAGNVSGWSAARGVYVP